MYIQQRMIKKLKSLKVLKSKGENLLKNWDNDLFSAWNLQQTDKWLDRQTDRQTDGQTFVILESLLRLRMLTRQCLFEYITWNLGVFKCKDFVFLWILNWNAIISVAGSDGFPECLSAFIISSFKFFVSQFIQIARKCFHVNTDMTEK